MAFSSKTGEDDTYNRDLVGAYQTEIDRGYHSVTPCLYTKGKSVWTGETSGCHARAVVLWEKGVTGWGWGRQTEGSSSS